MNSIFNFRFVLFIFLIFTNDVFSQDEDMIFMTEAGEPMGDLIDEQGRNYFIDANEKGKLGLMLEYEKEIIPYQYDDLEVEGKYLIAKIGDRKGVISRNGKLLVPVKYQYINNFWLSSHWEVINNQKKGLYDKSGNLIAETLYDNIEDIHRKVPFYSLKNEGLVNLLNPANGEKIFKSDYQELSFFKIGAKGGFYLALVKKNNKYGVIDFHENIVVPFKYDKISAPNSYGQYLDVYIDNEKYFYDLFNRIELKSIEKEENVIETQLYKNLDKQAKTLNIIGGLDGAATSYYKDSTIVFYDENLILEKGGKRGIYNLIQNKIVIPVDYDEIINSHYAKINECFLLKKGGLYTIISKFNLDPVTSEKFEEVKRLKSKFYFLGCNDGKCSLFDYSGKKLLAELSSFQELGSPLLKVEKSGKFGVFNLLSQDMEIPFSELDIEVIDRKSLKIGEYIYRIDPKLIGKRY